MRRTGRAALKSARRVVVKIGTGALTNATGRFLRPHFERLAADLLWAAEGRELVVVSSGAIALGVERLKLSARPKDMPGKQACAAAGQSRLMRAYDDAFEARGRVVAQVLLTHEDVQDRRRYLNARHALERLLAAGAVPIINENDTVAVEEIKFGDNDALAALVATLVRADALVILSDVEGLYDSDPRENPAASLVREVPKVTDEVQRLAGGSATGHGTGGMATKAQAAALVTQVGIRCVVTSGRVPGRLREVLEGKPVGTHFEPQAYSRHARAAWISHALRARGKVWVDDGARRAVVEGRKSLLPSGIKRVEGTFAQGDPVDLVDANGAAFARGLAAYGAEELRRIAGHRSGEIEGILGYRHLDEAVHRDDLSMLD